MLCMKIQTYQPIHGSKVELEVEGKNGLELTQHCFSHHCLKNLHNTLAVFSKKFFLAGE